MKEKQTRKRLDAQTKEYILKSVLEEGVKVSDLAFKFEIGTSTIHKWIKDYRDANSEDITRYITSSELEKVQAAYEKKVRDLEEENAILKKAMHIFAKNPE
ncbi:transposase [Solibacillus sp. FSL K6-4121]|uniref:transposase n=1 Tax=Solibacillus sp. FSL K6-4121 TaxID=2921505 RepID=UPI0030F91D47